MAPWGPPEGLEKLQDLFFASAAPVFMIMALRNTENSPQTLPYKAPYVPRPPRLSLVGRVSGSQHAELAVGDEILPKSLPGLLGAWRPGAPEHFWAIPWAAVGQRGTISGAGVIGSLIRRSLGEFSVICKVRSELVRPILDLLDPAKHLRLCF